MNITQVKIFPVEEDKLKAFVSIVFDHCFMVNDIKVIQGKDGLFLSMPSRRKKSGEFKDVAHPLNNETRRHIEETVLREYRAVVSDPTPRRPDRPDDEDGLGEPPAMSGAGQNGSGRGLTEPATATVAGTERGSAVGDDRDEGSGETSLEKVQEEHLRDSFWTVS